MSGPQPGGLEVARRTPGPARMLAWAGSGDRRLETARAVLGEHGLRATGTLVVAEDGAEPYAVSYTLSTDETGALSRLSVRATTAGGERQVLRNRAEDGIWLLDPPGPGRARSDFDGAADAVLGSSPLFAALPARRLGLHRAGGADTGHGLSLVHVDVPSLEVSVVQRTYRRAPGGAGTRVSVEGAGTATELVLDESGLVVELPGLARRV